MIVIRQNYTWPGFGRFENYVFEKNGGYGFNVKYYTQDRLKYDITGNVGDISQEIEISKIVHKVFGGELIVEENH